MTRQTEGESKQINDQVSMEEVVGELKKKAETLQQIADNARTRKAQEELEKGRSLERVFDIYFDR